MVGTRFLAEVRELHPAMRTILMSGRADLDGSRDRGPGRPDALLAKPFKMSELMARIRTVLEA